MCKTPPKKRFRLSCIRLALSIKSLQTVPGRLVLVILHRFEFDYEFQGQHGKALMHTIGYNWFSNPDVQHKDPSNSLRLSCVGHLFIVKGLRKSFAYPAGRRPFFVCLTSSNPLEAVWPDTIHLFSLQTIHPMSPHRPSSQDKLYPCRSKAILCLVFCHGPNLL